MTITILKAESFAPLGKAIPKPAAPAPVATQIKPGIWRNPDGTLETRQVEKPLPVVPNALADGWIEWKPGMPIPSGPIGIQLTDSLGYVGIEDSAGLASGWPPEIFTWENKGYKRCTAYKLIA